MIKMKYFSKRSIDFKNKFKQLSKIMKFWLLNYKRQNSKLKNLKKDIKIYQNKMIITRIKLESLKQKSEKKS